MRQFSGNAHSMIAVLTVATILAAAAPAWSETEPQDDQAQDDQAQDDQAQDDDGVIRRDRRRRMREDSARQAKIRAETVEREARREKRRRVVRSKRDPGDHPGDVEQRLNPPPPLDDDLVVTRKRMLDSERRERAEPPDEALKGGALTATGTLVGYAVAFVGASVFLLLPYLGLVLAPAVGFVLLPLFGGFGSSLIPHFFDDHERLYAVGPIVGATTLALQVALVPVLSAVGIAALYSWTLNPQSGAMTLFATNPTAAFSILFFGILAPPLVGQASALLGGLLVSFFVGFFDYDPHARLDAGLADEPTNGEAKAEGGA